MKLLCFRMQGLIVPLLIFVLLAQSCKKDSTSTTDSFSNLDRKSILSSIATNVVIPETKAFESSAKSLQTESDSFQSHPTLAGLLSLKSKWKIALLSWRMIEFLELGPMENATSGIIADIDYGYTRPSDLSSLPASNDIETLLSRSALVSSSTLDSFGAKVKGFSAIEYLLFSLTSSDQQVLSSYITGNSAKVRLSYLQALCNQLADRAAIISSGWDPAKGNYTSTFVKADGRDINSSFGKLINALVKENEILKNERTSRSLGKLNSGIHQPEAIENRISAASWESVQASIQGMKNIFEGNISGMPASPGIDDLLNELNSQFEGGQKLSEVTEGQFNLTIAKTQGQSVSMYESAKSNPALIENLYNELKKLLVLIKVDMTSNVGVLLTYTDNDGD